MVVVQLPDCTSIVYLYNFGPSALSWTPTSFSATFLAPFPYSCPSPNRRATYTAAFPWASSLIPIRESCTDSFVLAFWVFCFFSFASCCGGACHACLCAKFIVVQSFNLKKTLVIAPFLICLQQDFGRLAFKLGEVRTATVKPGCVEWWWANF